MKRERRPKNRGRGKRGWKWKRAGIGTWVKRKVS